MKVVPFDLCFRLKGTYTFHIFKMHFSLIIIFKRTTAMEAKQIEACIGD